MKFNIFSILKSTFKTASAVKPINQYEQQDYDHHQQVQLEEQSNEETQCEKDEMNQYTGCNANPEQFANGIWPKTLKFFSRIMKPTEPEFELPNLNYGKYRFENASRKQNELDTVLKEMTGSEMVFINFLNQYKKEFNQLSCHFSFSASSSACFEKLTEYFAEMSLWHQNVFPYFQSGLKDATECNVDLDTNKEITQDLSDGARFGKYILTLFMPIINVHEKYIFEYISFYNYIQELREYSAEIEVELQDIECLLVGPFVRLRQYRCFFSRIARCLRAKGEKRVGHFEACIRRLEFLLKDINLMFGIEENFADIRFFEDELFSRGKIGHWKGYSGSKVFLKLTSSASLGYALPCAPRLQLAYQDCRLVPEEDVIMDRVPREGTVFANVKSLEKLEEKIILVVLSDTILIFKREEPGLLTGFSEGDLMYPPVPLSLVKLEYFNDRSLVIRIKLPNENPLYIYNNGENFVVFYELFHKLVEKMVHNQDYPDQDLAPVASPVESGYYEAHTQEAHIQEDVQVASSDETLVHSNEMNNHKMALQYFENFNPQDEKIPTQEILPFENQNNLGLVY